jgi:hypothetical protein
MKIRNFAAITCLLLNIKLIKADQPVHCLREQLFGVWNFHVSKNKSTINLFDTKEVCTHSLPNKL